jgi:hypothetical protein
VFRAYFINGRGDEAMGSVWSYLDMTALWTRGGVEDSPEGYPQSRPYKWWNWNDSYVPGARPDPKWVRVSDVGEPPFAGIKARPASGPWSLSSPHGGGSVVSVSGARPRKS